MKTDEIIKGLRICSGSGELCEDCPYHRFKTSKCIRSLAKDAAELIEKLMGEHSWVSTSERLPEDGQEVIIILQKSKAARFVTYQQDCDMFYIVGGLGAVGTSFVTHWMPLPELPEEA